MREVVEFMRPNYWLELKSPFFAQQPWFAGFTRTGETGWNGVPDNQCGADSACVAVCLAALRAKGVEVTLELKS